MTQKDQRAFLMDEKEADQFAPFLDEIVDAGDLQSAAHGAAPSTPDSSPANQWMTIGDMGPSKTLFQEMSLVKSRIGFDERDFREQCQRVQTMLTSEFKGTKRDQVATFVLEIVDKLYDAVDAMVSDYSKAMYQIQVENLKSFETSLLDIRRIGVQIATTEQAIKQFYSQLNMAYKQAFEANV